MYPDFTPKKYVAKIHIKIEIPTFRYGFLNYLYFISIKNYTIRNGIIRLYDNEYKSIYNNKYCLWLQHSGERSGTNCAKPSIHGFAPVSFRHFYRYTCAGLRTYECRTTDNQ